MRDMKMQKTVIDRPLQNKWNDWFFGTILTFVVNEHFCFFFVMSDQIHVAIWMIAFYFEIIFSIVANSSTISVCQISRFEWLFFFPCTKQHSYQLFSWINPLCADASSLFAAFTKAFFSVLFWENFKLKR